MDNQLLHSDLLPLGPFFEAFAGVCVCEQLSHGKIQGQEFASQGQGFADCSRY